MTSPVPPLPVPGVPPASLRLPNLLCATDRYSERVLDGGFDHLLPVDGLPADRRWYTRLHTDDDLDVWLISWAAGHTTELHDHGGSLGALTVLTGALHEYRWTGKALRRRTLEAGDQAAFPLGWVHDVGAAEIKEQTGQQTLSVHAYSPPLTVMSYYEVTGRQTLRRTRTALTDLSKAG